LDRKAERAGPDLLVDEIGLFYSRALIGERGIAHVYWTTAGDAVPWAELLRSPDHAFYDNVQVNLVAAGFDPLVETWHAAAYAARVGHPSRRELTIRLNTPPRVQRDPRPQV